jgi:paraquat-inducible protein B
MYQFQNGQKSMHPSTAAGYVIESMVNKAIEKKPGVKLQDTGLLEGTRPDVVIDHGAGIVGMLDITASNSAGHILSKKGNWLNHKNIPLVMESLYPSINFTTMDRQQLSEEDLQEIQAWLKESQAALELAEQEKERRKKEHLAEMQNGLQQQVNKLKGALQSIVYVQDDSKPVLRSDDRMQSNFKKCGWIVNFDSTLNVWGMERLSYDAWKEKGYSSAETDEAFAGLKDKLEKMTTSADSISFLANME